MKPTPLNSPSLQLTTTPLKGEEKSERRDRCVYKKQKKKTLPTHERE